MSEKGEKTYISSLFKELNSNLPVGIDTEPNFSRSAARPRMYCGLRSGEVENFIYIGTSNAGKLCVATTSLGMNVNAFNLASGGWKLSKDNVDKLKPDLKTSWNALQLTAPVSFSVSITRPSWASLQRAPWLH
jgi:hypothetical protein